MESRRVPALDLLFMSRLTMRTSTPSDAPLLAPPRSKTPVPKISCERALYPAAVLMAWMPVGADAEKHPLRLLLVATGLDIHGPS